VQILIAMKRTSRSGLVLAVTLAPLLLVAGCGGLGNTSGSTTVACRPLTATAATKAPGWGGTVFNIVMENHNYDQIIGNASAPYINSLLQQGADAVGYHGPFVHPSKPNYIWMVAGENFGILDNDDPSPGAAIGSQSHLADQIEKAGLTWRTYQEGMGAPCGLSSHGRYAVKHNPFAYFADISGSDGRVFQPSDRCLSHMVDYSRVDADIAAGTVPDYVFVTPDLVNDMHDGTIAAGDSWLSHEIPKILATDAYKNGGSLFLLWDEGSANGDDPPFIALSPNARAGFVSQTTYDTTSYLKTVQAILGLETLPCAPQPDAVPLMSDLFTVPLAASAP
jgi:hypothetical protein